MASGQESENEKRGPGFQGPFSLSRLRASSSLALVTRYFHILGTILSNPSPLTTKTPVHMKAWGR